MDRIKICLFGKFSIHNRGKETFELGSRKAEELFGYLLIYRGRAHTRDALAELFWGEETAHQTKNYLRKTLWQLQSSLENLISANKNRLLQVDAEWIQINPECNLALDVAMLEDAFLSVTGIRGQNLTLEQARSLEEAAALYKGDLMEGCYLDWCLFERERLQYMLLGLLDKLMDFYEQSQDYETGLAHGERVLRYDRAHESTHTRLMRLYYLAGDRTSALRQYAKCQQALREELDTEPGQFIRELYHQIRRDAVDSKINGCTEITPRPDSDALQIIHNRLDHFHKILIQLQAQLLQDIEVLERVIGK
jgi:DNA-binding SARP family transcriptional activator